MWAPLLSVGLSALAFLGGVVVGRRHERERAAEEADRMLRIDPPNRTQGLPTNLDGEPSNIKKPRIARSHLMR